MYFHGKYNSLLSAKKKKIIPLARWASQKGVKQTLQPIKPKDKRFLPSVCEKNGWLQKNRHQANNLKQDNSNTGIFNY